MYSLRLQTKHKSRTDCRPSVPGFRARSFLSVRQGSRPVPAVSPCCRIDWRVAPGLLTGANGGRGFDGRRRGGRENQAVAWHQAVSVPVYTVTSQLAYSLNIQPGLSVTDFISISCPSLAEMFVDQDQAVNITALHWQACLSLAPGRVTPLLSSGIQQKQKNSDLQQVMWKRALGSPAGWRHIAICQFQMMPVLLTATVLNHW